MVWLLEASVAGVADAWRAFESARLGSLVYEHHFGAVGDIWLEKEAIFFLNRMKFMAKNAET